MTATNSIHTCSYYCERPECVRRQRDELRNLLAETLEDVRKTKHEQKGVVAWARLVYARPVNAPKSAEEWDEMADVEFHTRPEKPEGEGWYPLVVGDRDLTARVESDTALLRQALEALLGQRGEPDWNTGKQRENAIAALRESLGVSNG